MYYSTGSAARCIGTDPVKMHVGIQDEGVASAQLGLLSCAFAALCDAVHVLRRFASD